MKTTQLYNYFDVSKKAKGTQEIDDSFEVPKEKSIKIKKKRKLLTKFQYFEEMQSSVEICPSFQLKYA